MAEFATPEFLTFMQAWAARQSTPVRVLEVGGGSKSYLGLSGARFTSLEATPESLAKSSYAQERLLGDAQCYDYGDRQYDVVSFWNVLEHIERPEQALARALATLRPGGLIVLRGPELESLKAFVTRWTPHGFHVLFYRRVLGSRHAGRTGHAPFPVTHGAEASMAQLEDQLAGAGLRSAFRQRYVGDQLQLLHERYPLAYHIYQGTSGMLRAVTQGRLGVASTDFVVAYTRQADSADESLTELATVAA